MGTRGGPRFAKIHFLEGFTILKVTTRLTYNCAHLRWTKESLTFDYLEKGKLFLRKSRKTKKEEEENI